MPDLTNATAQPVSTPAPAASTPESAPVADGGIPDFAKPIDFTAKLAAFRSATAAPAAEAPAASETPAPAAEVVTPPPAPAASPEPAQAPQTPSAEQVAAFERLAKAEADREALAAKLAELEPRASTAEQIEAALAKDPIQFLLDRGVTHETLQDFLINGPKKPDPRDAEVAELKAKITAREEAEQQAAIQESIREWKTQNVVPHVTEAAFPLLTAVHGEQASELVYNVMNHHHLRGESVSAQQAAARLEGELAGLYERMAAKKAPKPAPAAPAPAAPPAPKQRPRELVNGGAGSEAEPVAEPDSNERFSRALEMMKRKLGSS